jgi:hypothetical protein
MTFIVAGPEVRPTFDPVEHLAAGSDGLDLSGPKIGKLGTLSVR